MKRLSFGAADGGGLVGISFKVKSPPITHGMGGDKSAGAQRNFGGIGSRPSKGMYMYSRGCVCHLYRYFSRSHCIHLH